jgi:AcrR family transcriptional regulator
VLRDADAGEARAHHEHVDVVGSGTRGGGGRGHGRQVIGRGAGISRPTFSFASKEAVLLSLLDRVVSQGREERDRAREPEEALGAAARWRRGVESFLATFTEHRAVTLAVAVAAAAAGSAEVRALWAGVMGLWVDETAAAIEAERARGAARGGAAARDLATALVSVNEQVVHRSLSGQQPAVDPAAVTDLLVAIWLRAIYSDEGAG